MMLEQFFTHYFEQIDPSVLKMYQDLMPGQENLARAYAEMFSRNDEESIAFLLQFYRKTGELRHKNPEQAILFNVHNNVCFPFFVKHTWKMIGEENRNKIYQYANTMDQQKIYERLDQERDFRNWFRKEIGFDLKQEDLFTLNEIIALQNFSSGGESSFLRFAYPELRKMKGRVLDAGCGAGFASLVLSQHMEVYAVDACRPRLERAMALSQMMQKGEKEVFPGVIQLIEDELGEIAVEYDFPTADRLLNGKPYPVSFIESSLDSIPCEDSFFDAINCLDVLEHTFSPTAIVREFSRVSKPGGRVFITAPTLYGEVEQRIHESIEGAIFPAMLHMHHFDARSLSNLFAENGFKEIEIRPFDYIPWAKFLEFANQVPEEEEELVKKLKAKPREQVPLQLFAIFERV